MIRVIGGTARGRRLQGPPGLRFRPTTGRVKEFIFSYLNQEVEGARLLDLFSGTGSLGIEALSRGAASVVFIEEDTRHIRILKDNVALCGFSAEAQIIRGDVFRHIKRLGEGGERFDIVLADPPFKQKLHERITKGVRQAGILARESLLLIEHEVHDSISMESSLRLIKQRRFGHCVVSVYV